MWKVGHMRDGSLRYAISICRSYPSGFGKATISKCLSVFHTPVFNLSILFLIISMHTKKNILSKGNSTVWWRLFRGVRQSSTASVLSILAKVFSTW